MKVYLRAFEPEDYKLINKWRQDEEYQKLTGGNKFYISSERDKKWVEEKIHNDRNETYWAICVKENNEFIGFMGINDFDWINRKAKWHTLVIGKKKYRNIKYTLDAILLMLDHAFNQLDFHRIYGYYLQENKASIMLGKMVGFKIEGTLREAVFKNGKHHDLLAISILKEEYLTKKKD